MAYYLTYVTGMKKVVYGVLLLQLVLTWPSSSLVLVVLQVISNTYPSSVLPSRGCQNWPTLKLAYACKLDSIWVIVNRPTKSARFIPVKTKYRAEKYAEIYIARVLCLHGVLKMIIFDRGSQFIARFWEQLHASLGVHLIHSSTYHPQTDGQTKRVN
jgi:hypothetical protein